MKDALGNPIIAGNKYGYAHNKSGHNNVTIGIAEKITSERVTLKVTKHQTSIYNDELMDHNVEGLKKVSVKGCMLFPVN